MSQTAPTTPPTPAPTAAPVQPTYDPQAHQPQAPPAQLPHPEPPPQVDWQTRAQVAEQQLAAAQAIIGHHAPGIDLSQEAPHVVQMPDGTLSYRAAAPPPAPAPAPVQYAPPPPAPAAVAPAGVPAAAAPLPGLPYATPPMAMPQAPAQVPVAQQLAQAPSQPLAHTDQLRGGYEALLAAERAELQGQPIPTMLAPII